LGAEGPTGGVEPELTGVAVGRFPVEVVAVTPAPAIELVREVVVPFDAPFT
jgi:hypothetical protein